MNIWLIAALWMTLALVAALGSIRLGVSVALVEILIGVLAGNMLHLQPTPWIDFLAGCGSVILTFLAGAEIDPGVLRANFRESLSIGFFSFLAPGLAAFAAAYWLFRWPLHGAEIAGVALSTTSVAVAYAVMVESGRNETELGKVILAACFITDLGTVVALGLLFANYDRRDSKASSANSSVSGRPNQTEVNQLRGQSALNEPSSGGILYRSQK